VKPALTDALLFQLGWFACVAGGNRGALLSVAIVLPLQAVLVPRMPREWIAALGMACAGLLVDLGWQALGVLRFERAPVGVVPPWLALVWLLFALALGRSLAWLQGRVLLAAVAGAVAGPLSYLAGLGLGAARSDLPSWQLALLMAASWSLLLPALAACARRAGPAPGAVPAQ